MVLECDQCGALVDAAVQKEHWVEHPSGDQYMYTLATCPRCESPFIALQEVDFDRSRSCPERLYPPTRTAGSSSLPATIRPSFEEAATCFRAKAYTATTIMCRKTLEGICQAHDVRERTLDAALTKLRDNGTIDARLYEWADELRLFGNDAAHDVTVTIDAADARDILEFTRALVEYVFTFRERFQEFKTRRSVSAT